LVAGAREPGLGRRKSNFLLGYSASSASDGRPGADTRTVKSEKRQRARASRRCAAHACVGLAVWVESEEGAGAGESDPRRAHPPHAAAVQSSPGPLYMLHLLSTSAVRTLSLSSLTPGWPASSTVVRERGLSLHVLCVLPGVGARGSLHLQSCWRALVHSTSKQLCPPHIYCSAMNFPLSPTAEYPDPSGPALRPQLCLVYLYLYIHAPAGPFHPSLLPFPSGARPAPPSFPFLSTTAPRLGSAGRALISRCALVPHPDGRCRYSPPYTYLWGKRIFLSARVSQAPCLCTANRLRVPAPASSSSLRAIICASLREFPLGQQQSEARMV
jgi:hypothetical protein